MHTPKRSPRLVRGMTLVEMMVAITIGMIIVAAMAVLFANNSRTRGETEKAAQKIENGRYALDLVSSDLHHAGYFATFMPSTLATPATLPDPCTTSSDLPALQAALPLHVQGYDNYTSGLSCISGVKAGSDVLFIRRVSTCAVGTTGCTAVGAPAFQASNCRSQLNTVADTIRLATDATSTDLDRKPRHLSDTALACGSTANAPVYQLVHRFYFVAANDKAGDGIPTLKRADLGASGFTTTSLVQGVENLQLEYGIDTNNDGNADVYTPSPAVYFDCPATNTMAVCMGHWANVVSTKVFVLARNLETSGSHQDSKKYVLGATATVAGVPTAPNEIAATNDAYKRSVFQEVVRLQNPSSRKFSP